MFAVISSGFLRISCKEARETSGWSGEETCRPSAWPPSTPSWTLGSTSCSERQWSSRWCRKSSVCSAKWAEGSEGRAAVSVALTAASPPPSSPTTARRWCHASSRIWWTLHRASCSWLRGTTRDKRRRGRHGTRCRRADFLGVVWKAPHWTDPLKTPPSTWRSQSRWQTHRKKVSEQIAGGRLNNHPSCVFGHHSTQLSVSTENTGFCGEALLLHLCKVYNQCTLSFYKL